LTPAELETDAQSVLPSPLKSRGTFFLIICAFAVIVFAAPQKTVTANANKVNTVISEYGFSLFFVKNNFSFLQGVNKM
jgi:hypothetical protein